MQENIEQCYTIKFCVKLNKSSTDTFASLIEAYGEATLSRTMVFKWQKAFKEGWENVEDDPRSGRPILSTNDQYVEVVRAVMAKDRGLSVRMIAEETGLNKNAVHWILTEHLHMRKICAKLVPKNLSGAKSEPVGNLSGFAGKTRNWTKFFAYSNNRRWIMGVDYNPETKRQSEEWHTKSSPRPKKASMSRSRVKTMIIVFFNSRGIVHKEFVPPG